MAHRRRDKMESSHATALGEGGCHILHLRVSELIPNTDLEKNSDPREHLQNHPIEEYFDESPA